MRNFTTTRDFLDVTPLREPDLTWKHNCRCGFAHRWEGYTILHGKFVEDIPATEEYPAYGHYECKVCREEFEPEWTVVTVKQYVGGLISCFIDDEEVSKEVYQRELAKEKA